METNLPLMQTKYLIGIGVIITSFAIAGGALTFISNGSFGPGIPAGDYKKTELTNLVENVEDYQGQKVKVKGKIENIGATIVMWGDCRLSSGSATILVKWGESVEKTPSAGTSVTLSGTVGHKSLEGGFYYLSADGWKS